MRRTYKWCALFLSVLMLMCACGTNDTPQTDDTNTPNEEDTSTMQEVTAFPIAPVDGTFSYAVMRREDSSSAERDALIAIRNALKDVYGASPKPETEYDTEELTDEQIAARFEILVGQTGRPESDEVYASLGDNEYTVCVKGHKLVVLGKNDTLTAFAVKAFERMIKQAPQNIVGDYAYLKSYIPGAYDGSYDFEDLGYEKVTDVRFEVRNGENNADIFYITSDNYHYTYGYYSNNSWVDGDILIAARSARDDAVNFGPAELVALDIYNEEAWLLPITAKGYSEYVVDSELIYYLTGNDLRCFNLLTGTEHTVITMSSMSFPHITANGSHINVSRHVNGLDTGTVINTQTGETYDIMAVRFEEPYPIANHHMICPTDPTVMFFSHEGTTTDIPDRLWIAKLGEEPYNIAYQTVDANGKPLDCFGHEYWAPDGEGLYFVKYSVSPSFPKGVCYVSLDDIENPEVLYSKYPYWHVSCSPDGRYVTSDTQSGSYSGVCLIDTETDEEIMVYKAQTYRQTHPGHPHPCFNTTSTALCFNDHNLDNGRVSIGVYIISE